jgi:hypothetical protein
MFKRRDTDASGKPFDAATVEAVWSRAPISSEHPPLRLDAFGALIWKEGYGNMSSKLGWEIGYKKPLAEGGTDALDNLHAVQWGNNRRNGES